MTFADPFLRVERCEGCSRIRVPLGVGTTLFFTSDGMLDIRPGRFCGTESSRSNHEYQLVRRVPTGAFIATIEAALGFGTNAAVETPLDPDVLELESLRKANRSSERRISGLQQNHTGYRLGIEHGIGDAIRQLESLLPVDVVRQLRGRPRLDPRGDQQPGESLADSADPENGLD